MVNHQPVVYLVRHGETADNANGIIHGSDGSPLNERGREQGAHLRERLATRDFDVVFSSPALRARQTAAYVSDRVEILPDLRELDWGAFTGRTWPDVRAEFPEALNERSRLEFGFRAPGGETGTEVIERATRVLEGILATPAQTCCCVTHAGWLRLLFAHLLCMRYPALPTLTFDNARFSVVRHNGQRWKVDCLNCD